MAAFQAAEGGPIPPTRSIDIFDRFAILMKPSNEGFIFYVGLAGRYFPCLNEIPGRQRIFCGSQKESEARDFLYNYNDVGAIPPSKHLTWPGACREYSP